MQKQKVNLHRKAMMQIPKYRHNQVWFTADTHFNDPKIIEYCKRGFFDVQEMNEQLISNWNKKIPKDGIVFHLGDFCHGGTAAWKEIRSKLNGKIHLILGNHDIKNIRPNSASLFESVSYQQVIEIDGQTIIMNHYPFLCYAGRGEDVWQIFGHVHSGFRSRTGKDLPLLVNLSHTQYDVGIDNNLYRPISYIELENILKYKK